MWYGYDFGNLREDYNSLQEEDCTHEEDILPVYVVRKQLDITEWKHNFMRSYGLTFGNLNNSDLKNVVFELLLLVFMDTCSISDDDENGTESRSYFLFYVYVYVNHPDSAAFCLSFWRKENSTN